MKWTYIVVRLAVLTLFVFLSFSGIAQNYQCLQSGVKHYFTNSDGYLRGIRIDSIKSYADSIVFYPYHSPRGRFYDFAHPMDTAGGSWLGKRVLQLNDGTFLFDNIWNDTAIIKTQVHLGDKWNLYDDTTVLYYEAEVVAEDTMTVLGSVDSVKKILITAKKPSGIVTTDSVNGFQILLSKNNGFVQVFDLYTFPYHAPDSVYQPGTVDYFLDLMGGPSLAKSVFSLVSFKWPTKTELYNWNVGDAYEIKYCASAHSYLDCLYPSHFDYDSVVSKVVFPDSVQYSTVGWQVHQVEPYSGPIPDRYYPYGNRAVNKTFTVANIPIFDSSLFPEEYRQDTIYYYYPHDTTFCITGEKYYTEPSVRWEGSGPFYSYKKDINLVYEYIDPPTGISLGQKLIYYSHNGNRCGSYIGSEIVRATNVQKEDHTIDLFPNPATDEITLSGNEIIEEITLYNTIGQQVANYRGNGRKLTVNVASLPQGLYTVRVNGNIFKKFVKE